MTQMSAQREHDYFAETVICANCYIVAKRRGWQRNLCQPLMLLSERNA